MSDFLEGLHRQDANRAASERQHASVASMALQRATVAAAQINKGWADLASYLAQGGVRTFQYRHYHVNWRHKLMSHYMPMSPTGFVVSASPGGHWDNYGRHQQLLPRKASRNLVSLVLLMPDGRRWRHNKASDVNEPPTQGFEDLTPESIVDGPLALRIDDAGNIFRSLGYGEEELYFDYLGKLAQTGRSPEHCARLWR